MEREWVLEIRELCSAAGVEFFFKQWEGGARRLAAGRWMVWSTAVFPPGWCWLRDSAEVGLGNG